jgi:acyl-coenzyme A thioesterase PaaI-like protein
LNYLKPVSSGTISARGACIRSGRIISYAEARVEDTAGELLAHGTSTLMALPGKGIFLGVEKFIEDRDGSFQ